MDNMQKMVDRILKQEVLRMYENLRAEMKEKIAFTLFVSEYYRFIMNEIDKCTLHDKTKKEISNLWEIAKRNERVDVFFIRADEIISISNLKEIQQ